jgi:hypothetical protein
MRYTHPEGDIDNLLESFPAPDQAPQETRKFWVKSVVEGLERTRVTRGNAVHKRTLIDRHARNRVGQLICWHLFNLRSCRCALKAEVSDTASSLCARVSAQARANFHTRLPGALTLTQTPKCHIIFDKRDGITAWHLTDVYWPGWGFSRRLSRAAASRALLRH